MPGGAAARRALVTERGGYGVVRVHLHLLISIVLFAPVRRPHVSEAVDGFILPHVVQLLQRPPLRHQNLLSVSHSALPLPYCHVGSNGDLITR